jgi:hypothetical protein
MIAILTAVSTEYLAQQPAQLSSAIQQFTLKLEETRALALANAGSLTAGNGTDAAAGGGATLRIQTDPSDSNYSIATLYWYRPILQNPCGGCMQIDTGSTPLRVRARMSATIPPFDTDSGFSIFISPSGHLSAVPSAVWPFGSGAILSEPTCDPDNAPSITFSANGNEKTRRLQCTGAQLMPQ